MKTWVDLLKYPRFGADGILKRMEKLIEPVLAGQWAQRNPVIKITGSNGKGSVAHLLARYAQLEDVKKVGIYTSPHLFEPSERIQINATPIAPSALDQALSRVFERVEDPEKTGRFELLSAAAVYHFERENVDLAIMEVGLGGRLDPIKMTPGRVTILTSVDLEHTHILGETRIEIAHEKAALAKPGDVLIHGIEPTLLPPLDGVKQLGVDGTNGTYEQLNNQLAATALSQFLQQNVALRQLSSNLPGRFQFVQKDPDVIVDVAHTAQAIKACLLRLGSGRHRIFLGLKADKNLKEIAAVLKASAHELTLFDIGQEGRAPDHLEAAFSGLKCHHLNTLSSHLEEASAGQQTLCLGGFDMVRKVACHFDPSLRKETIHI